MSKYKIAIASDHAGFQLKKELSDYLLKKEISVKDFGTFSQDSCDYPDFAHPLADAIENNDFDFGVAICYTGNGINMTVNKHQRIRSALCWNKELASFARAHNNANILSLPAGFISTPEAILILDTFLKTTFEGGRHQRRIDKIPLNLL